MIVQFSHLVLLFLAVQAIAANQGGAHHASFPADPSRLNPSPPHQQHQYSYQQGNQQPESVHSQQAPPQQAPQQAPQQLPPHLSMGRNMHRQSTSTPPGFGNQQQSNLYRRKWLFLLLIVRDHLQLKFSLFSTGIFLQPTRSSATPIARNFC